MTLNELCDLAAENGLSIRRLCRMADVNYNTICCARTRGQQLRPYNMKALQKALADHQERRKRAA